MLKGKLNLPEQTWMVIRVGAKTQWFRRNHKLIELPKQRTKPVKTLGEMNVR